jgi:hypothetical protein
MSNEVHSEEIAGLIASAANVMQLLEFDIEPATLREQRCYQELSSYVRHLQYRSQKEQHKGGDAFE